MLALAENRCLPAGNDSLPIPPVFIALQYSLPPYLCSDLNLDRICIPRETVYQPRGAGRRRGVV